MLFEIDYKNFATKKHYFYTFPRSYKDVRLFKNNKKRFPFLVVTIQVSASGRPREPLASRTV